MPQKSLSSRPRIDVGARDHAARREVTLSPWRLGKFWRPS